MQGPVRSVYPTREYGTNDHDAESLLCLQKIKSVVD